MLPEGNLFIFCSWFSALTLIRTIHFPAQVDVLESQFSQLLQQINSTRDFESIRLAHDHFLSNLLAQSFILLKPVSLRFLITTVKLITSVSLDFRELIPTHMLCSVFFFLSVCLFVCMFLISKTDFPRCFIVWMRFWISVTISVCWWVRIWGHWTREEQLSWTLWWRSVCYRIHVEVRDALKMLANGKC